MKYLKCEDFVRTVIKHIRYKPDRKDIQLEIEDHINDRLDALLSQGINEKEAEIKVIQCMGDPHHLGAALNKEHNPLLGYLWQLSNVLLLMIVMLLITQQIAPIVGTLDPPRGYEPTSNITYEQEVEQILKVDDVIFDFRKIVYEESGNVTLLYRYYYENIFDRIRYRLPVHFPPTFSTDLGPIPFGYHGPSDDALNIGYNYLTFKNLTPSATLLHVSLDFYDRHFQVDIPLNWSDTNE